MLRAIVAYITVMTQPAGGAPKLPRAALTRLGPVPSGPATSCVHGITGATAIAAVGVAQCLRARTEPPQQCHSEEVPRMRTLGEPLREGFAIRAMPHDADLRQRAKVDSAA